MAPILVKNDTHGKPVTVPDTLEDQEIIKCREFDCPFSYTLFYGPQENRTENGENLVATLRRLAHDQIVLDHPLHLIEVYVWDESDHSWVPKDQAKSAGIS